MADVDGFFNEYLPNKLKENPAIASSIGSVYLFDLGEEQWVVDLTSGGEVKQGGCDSADCTVKISKGDFGNLLDNPGSAMMMFTMGKIKVDNLSLGMSLQKLLG